MIRTAMSSDLAKIRDIAREAYARYVPRIGREPAPMTVDYSSDVMSGRVVVLEVDEVLISYMVAWSQGDAYFIENIGVAPAAQGKGWGRRLIDWAAAEARRLGLSSVQLYTNAAMTENLSMYAHLGFLVTHRVMEDGFDRVYMTLSLDPSEEHSPHRSGSATSS